MKLITRLFRREKMQIDRKLITDAVIAALDFEGVIEAFVTDDNDNPPYYRLCGNADLGDVAEYIAHRLEEAQ